jgi:hypothetical protein
MDMVTRILRLSRFRVQGSGFRPSFDGHGHQDPAVVKV